MQISAATTAAGVASPKTTEWKGGAKPVDGEAAGVEAGEFGGALAAADLVVLQSAQKPVQKPIEGLAAQPEAGAHAKPSGEIDKAVPRSIGGNPGEASLIQKVAVSANTGADIAGLKPWSPDWVFEGGMNRHPLQKTLLGDQAGGGSANVLAGLEQLLRQVDTASAGLQDGVGPDVRNIEQLKAEGFDFGVEGAETTPDAMELPPQALQKALGGDDFLSVRRNLQEVPVSAMQPTVAKPNLSVIPGAGAADATGIPTEARSAAALPGISSDKGKAVKPRSGGLDTLGLVHPHQAKADAGGMTNVLPFQVGSKAMQLDGQVVPGSMSRNRLSSDSIFGVTQGIRQLGVNGGGEMKIRLNPDHLGEIHVRVSAGGKTGSEVGLQIQASDERAKRILEESISSLKDGLASQSLTLSKIDVQVAQPQSRTSPEFQQSFEQGGAQAQLQNGDAGAGEGRQSRRDSEAPEMGTLRTSQRARTAWAPTSAAAKAAAGSGRLDVMA